MLYYAIAFLTLIFGDNTAAVFWLILALSCDWAKHTEHIWKKDER